MIELQEVYIQTKTGREYAGPDAEGLLRFTETKARQGRVLSAFFKQAEPVVPLTVDFIFSLDDAAIESVFCNGYQSWTDSREFFPEEEIKPLRALARPFLAPYGDSHFYQPRAPLYSFGYLYFRFGDEIKFIGSLNEHRAHTILAYDYKSHRLIASVDLEGVELKQGMTVLSLFLSEGDKEKVIVTYAKALGLPVLKPQPTTGFTSWYNFYTDISEEVLTRVLKSYSDRNIPLDYFQIDDGWQHAVGDWLVVNKKFPSGMAALANKIHGVSYKAGLWLAPFIVEKKSLLFKEHPEWILRDEKGRPAKAGFNPLWSYTFYALDWQRADVQAYLKQVFETVFQKWHFDMVKLDFLYAAALFPRNGKSRGQLMHEAMELLRRLCGKHQILGCGVPLMQAAGLVDYCRIGSDVDLQWENKLLRFVRYRERVSTINSLTSTIGRSHQNNIFFRNDPDVFILRSQRRSGQAKTHDLSFTQKETLFILNRILGSLVFTSDDIADYTPEESALYYSSFPAPSVTVKRILFYHNLLRADVSVPGRDYYIAANLTPREERIALPPGNWFERSQAKFYRGGTIVSLKPFQTLVFLHFETTPYTFAGSLSHMLPGCEFRALSLKKGKLIVKYHPQAKLRASLFFIAGKQKPNVPQDWSFQEIEKAGFRLWHLEPMKLF